MKSQFQIYILVTLLGLTDLHVSKPDTLKIALTVSIGLQHMGQEEGVSELLHQLGVPHNGE